MTVALIKHGTGRVLPDEEQQKKTAGKDWTEQDQADLDAENEQADSEDQA